MESATLALYPVFCSLRFATKDLPLRYRTLVPDGHACKSRWTKALCEKAGCRRSGIDPRRRRRSRARRRENEPARGMVLQRHSVISSSGG